MAYKRISPMPVVEGGSGAQTLTGVLIGNGASAFTGNAVTQYDTLVGGASNAISSIAPSATSGVPFISQGAASNPVFGTAVVAGGGTGAVTLTANGVLLGNGTSAVTATAAGTTGQVLTGVTGSAPTFQSPAASSISITGDTGGALVGNAFTFTGGTTGLKFGGSGTTETLSGTLVVGNGGTGATTLTGLVLGNGGASPMTAISYTDFESGTWTPTLIGASTAGTTVYSNQFGFYSRIGNTVTATCLITTSAQTGTGNMNIGGLPIAAYNSAGTIFIGSIGLSFAGAWPSGTTSIVWSLSGGATVASILCSGSASAFANMQMSNHATTVYATITYAV